MIINRLVNICSVYENIIGAPKKLNDLYFSNIAITIGTFLYCSPSLPNPIFNPKFQFLEITFHYKYLHKSFIFLKSFNIICISELALIRQFHTSFLYYKITFVNSQHKNINSISDFVLNNQF